ncbi:MAG: alkaline phosphatase family protein [Solirubrobacteraceae bacterium]
MPEVEHIVVLIMENHSFDNLLGMVRSHPTRCLPC